MCGVLAVALAFAALPAQAAKDRLDTPSSVMFEGTRLIVANQSFFTGDAASRVILDVEAGEQRMPEFIPRRAGLRSRRG